MTEVPVRRLEEDVRPGMRLGRHIAHDERSRAYAIQAAPAAGLRSVRHRRHVRPYDQGDVGACTGMACAGALSTAPFRHSFREATALKLYSSATHLDDAPGSWPPDDTGSDGLSVAKAAKLRGYIVSYEHAFTFDAFLSGLVTGPLIAGITWKTGCDEPDSDGRIRWAGSVRGGHEVCLDELDVERQRVWLTNSWSAAWGLAGRAWMSWSDWESALADDGDATLLNPA